MSYGPTGVTTEGAVRWTPPPGFENPVPEPGDRRGCGCGLLALILLGGIAALAIAFWSSIESGYDDVRDAYDDVKQSIEELGEDLEGESGQSQSTQSADGTGQLSDGRASIRYPVIDGMSEYARVGTDQQTGNDSYEVWGVSREYNGETSYLALDGATLPTPVNAANAAEFAGDIAGQFGQSHGSGSPPHRLTESKGVYRLSFEVAAPDGRDYYVVWHVRGDQAARFYCQAAPNDAEFMRLCRRAARTARVNL